MLKELILLIGVIILISFLYWFIGGIHLNYVRNESLVRLKDFDFENCVYEGYQRTIVNGFGGKIWYLCKKGNIYYSLNFTRRINNSEIQMYGPYQETTFPSQFEINK